MKTSARALVSSTRFWCQLTCPPLPPEGVCTLSPSATHNDPPRCSFTFTSLPLFLSPSASIHIMCLVLKYLAVRTETRKTRHESTATIHHHRLTTREGRIPERHPRQPDGKSAEEVVWCWWDGGGGSEGVAHPTLCFLFC